MAVKRTFLCIAMLATLVLVPRVSRAGDLVFSISPGSSVESAQIGKHVGNWMPYFGFDIMGIAAKGTYKDDYSHQVYNSGTSSWDTYREVSSEEIKGSATLFIPHIGARLYMGDAKKDVRPYVFGDLLKSFAFVSASDDYSYTDYINGAVSGAGTDNSSLSDDSKDRIKKVLGVLGVSAGFGCEYSFSERFSVGGEYGLRYLHTSTDGKTATGSGGSAYAELMNTEMSGSLKLTTGRLWLNYRL